MEKENLEQEVKKQIHKKNLFFWVALIEFWIIISLFIFLPIVTQ